MPHVYGRVPLDHVREFFCRFVVVEPHQADAVALWIAHTYVFETSRATPYLHFCSPEWGSGKTTALDVIAELAANAISIDDISGAALFRLIEADSPTVLLDEVDGLFAKRSSDAAEDHRKLLNSGYRKGKQAIRCGGRNNTELQRFNIYCPKALAGLNELPGTLAHRAIPIAMKPPRPQDRFEDFDPEEVEQEAATLREHLQKWAKRADPDLVAPGRKPAKLPELDARRNEIWRILFRIADLAGERWPDAAREAARALSGGTRRTDEASSGIRLLGDIRALFVEERASCAMLVEKLNADEQLPYGGWKDGRGITTRELGRKLAPYGIRAKPVRIDGERRGNGYEHEQFEDAWSRYLPDLSSETGTSGTSGFQCQDSAGNRSVQDAPAPVSESAANQYGQSDVPVVSVSKSEPRPEGGNDDLAYEERLYRKQEVDRSLREQLAAPFDPVEVEADRRLWAEAEELDAAEVEEWAERARQAIEDERL